MEEFIQKTSGLEKFDDLVVLSCDQRAKSRIKVILKGGLEAGIILPRGQSMFDGDFLLAKSGKVIQVKAAREKVSSIYSDNALTIAKASYHLGNRHVPTQLTATSVHYLHDHVIDEMLAGFSIKVVIEYLPFQPERGAYRQQHHQHDR